VLATIDDLPAAVAGGAAGAYSDGGYPAGGAR
jgi:hypothetical protein